MEYRILGPLTVRRDGEIVALGGPRQQTVLVALLIADGRAVGVDSLIEQVWGQDAPPKPVTSLRAYVTNLRHMVGSDALVSTAHGYRLDTSGDLVDAREFTRRVHTGRRLLDAGDVPGARRTLTDGLTLWRGEPLGEFRHLEFATPEAHRMDALRVDAIDAYFEAALQHGESLALVDGIESELLANPLRETLWGHLMLALYRGARRTEALRAFARACDVLDAELGVRPGEELERLAADIRTESPTLRWRASIAGGEVGSTVVPGNAPLRGRSVEIGRLQQTLRAATQGRGSVVVIRGDGGMGKSAVALRVTEMAAESGMATVWAGHADGLHRPPSWAWAHAVRGLAAQLPAGDRYPHAPLPGWWSTATETTIADDERSDSGFGAIEATTVALTQLVRARPALIVLDDLQRADRFTRQVLEHLSSALRCLPLLVIATWQDGATGGASTTRTFERLVGRTDIDVLRLHGLNVESTAEVIADTCGVTPSADFVDGVHGRTGGNPFYVREIVRLLVDNDRLDQVRASLPTDTDVPEAVSGVIRERMSRLPERTCTVLRVAAVAGTEFTTARLAAVTTSTLTDTSAALSPARAAGLIVSTVERRGYHRFSHGLVRDAVAAELTGVDRAVLHAAIARSYADDPGAVASEDAIDGAQHAYDAGSELSVDIAMLLIDRARADAWSRQAYRDVAELDRRLLQTCARLPAGSARFDREVELRLQLASVEAVISGQSSARVLADLRHCTPPEHDAVQSVTAVAMGCLEACGTGRYHDGALLSDALVHFFTATADPIAGAAGYYIRALTQFMRGALDLALASIGELQSTVPGVDWQTYGALASFEVLAYAIAAHAHALQGDVDRAHATLAVGTALGAERNDAFGAAVLRVAEIQLQAMTGDVEGLAPRAADVVTLLTELGIEQFLGGARVIHGWALATGPDCVDTTEDMRAALTLHGQGGRRIFSPLYFGLLSDAAAAHGDPASAWDYLRQAEALAAATGECVWDATLSARRLALAARHHLEVRGALITSAPPMPVRATSSGTTNLTAG